MSFVYAFFLWLFIPFVVYVLKLKKYSLGSMLRWAVLALLITALARPVLVQKTSENQVMAHSFIVALDLSVSMNANDIKPTRAKASEATVNKLLDENINDQIALIGFTTNPLLLSPPTTDHELVKIALKNLNRDFILTKGTNLRKLLEKVANFSDKEKWLVLLSDGGDEVLDEGLIDFVDEEQIKMFVIGMATKQGSAVETKEGGLLQNNEGEIIVTRLNDALEKLARESGGEFILFSSVDNTVSAIDKWIRSMGEGELLSQKSRDYFELAFVPLGLATILFFLSSTYFIRFFVTGLLLVGINVHANEILTTKKSSWAFLDAYHLQKAYIYYEEEAYKESYKMVMSMSQRDFESELLLAHIYYKLTAFKKAKSVLEKMKSSNPKVKQQLLYELGNCEAKLAYWEKAKNYYVQALQLGKDADSLHNLQVVIFQKQKHSSKVLLQHGSDAKASKNNKVNSEANEKEESSASESKSDVGAGGGDGSKKSKQSVVKVVKSDKNLQIKRTMSSKAYDLINEGYIRETKPW